MQTELVVFGKLTKASEHWFFSIVEENEWLSPWGFVVP